jgi:hypothetical protein
LIFESHNFKIQLITFYRSRTEFHAPIPDKRLPLNLVSDPFSAASLAFGKSGGRQSGLHFPKILRRQIHSGFLPGWLMADCFQIESHVLDP